MLQVAGVVLVSNLHGKPRGEKAIVQVLSHGVPEVVSVDKVYGLGLVPVGAALAAVMNRARSIETELLAVYVQAVVELSVTCVR